MKHETCKITLGAPRSTKGMQQKPSQWKQEFRQWDCPVCCWCYAHFVILVFNFLKNEEKEKEVSNKRQYWAVETGKKHSGPTAHQAVTSRHQARLPLIAQCSIFDTKSSMVSKKKWILQSIVSSLNLFTTTLIIKHIPCKSFQLLIDKEDKFMTHIWIF